MMNAVVGVQTQHSLSSFAFGIFGCSLITFGFVVSSNDFDHWFIIPVTLAGMLIAGDAIDWLRGKVSLLDPVGVVGLIGFHFFFLAPLLHVYWDYWMRWIVPPDDWRHWLGIMAIINCLGVVTYRAGRVLAKRRRGAAHGGNHWVLNEDRFLVLSFAAMAVTAALQVFVYARFGGVMGYIQSVTEADGLNTMQGLGWIVLISESFPLIAIMAFAVYSRRHGLTYAWPTLAALLILYLGLLLLFGGLRGSRSNTVWGLVLAVGVIHFWVQPISRRFVMAGLVVIVAFMYVYGLYKGAGLEGVRSISSEVERERVVEETGRSYQATLLADLGRADVQSFLLYRLLSEDRDYEYSYGRTYLGGVAILVPRQLVPDRPATKVQEGTNALYGQGAYAPGVRFTSRVYGLAGETMLNFGPYVVPLVYFGFGYVIGRATGFLNALDENDARWLLAPVLMNFCVILLVSDSDNLTFFIVKRLAVPLAIVVLATTVMHRSPGTYTAHDRAFRQASSDKRWISGMQNEIGSR